MILNLCHLLSDSDIGSSVEIAGWIHNKRDHGKILFIELRCHSYPQAPLQCVCINPSLIEKAQHINVESVVQVTGVVKARPGGTETSQSSIELEVSNFTVISESDHLPFPINKPVQNPDKKLPHRYLYLRTITNILKKRAEIAKYIRDYLTEKEFTEIDTPVLGTPSPEGARDFVIPSRRQPGCFYALPQSPQQYKQLLMVGGVYRYFQLAKCFRDEDSRADRLPGEFTQIDLEMSFVGQNDVLAMSEKFILELFNKFKPNDYTMKSRISRMTYEDAMNVYGSDKPDLRNPLRIIKLSNIFANEPPQVFSKSVSNNGVTLGIVLPDARKMNAKLFERCKDIVISNNGPGLVYTSNDGNELTGPAKVFTQFQKKHLEVILEPGTGMVILSMFPANDAYRVMGILRDFLGKEYGLIDYKRFEFLWVTDFPMYEKDEQSHVQFSHNPFSMPSGGINALNKLSPYEIKAEQYDLVCNGYELGSGAIRNSDRNTLIAAFKVAGYALDKIEKEFAGMLNAFRYGVPPHGGIAFGFERILMLLLECDNVRDVCAFPLSQSGGDLLMGGPRHLSQNQLKELNLDVCAHSDDNQPKTVEAFFEEAADNNSLEIADFFK